MKEEKADYRPTTTVTVERRLTSEQLNDIARQQNRVWQRMGEIEEEKKSFVARKAAELKAEEAKYNELANQFSNGIEWEPRLAYIFNDVERKEIQKIDCITGMIIETHVMSPSMVREILNKQTDIQDEEKKKEIEKEAPEGTAFLWKKFSDEVIKGEPEISKDMLALLDVQRLKYISLAIDYLYRSEKLPTGTTFNDAFESASEWFNQFYNSLEAGPVPVFIIPDPNADDQPTTEQTDTQAEPQETEETKPDSPSAESVNQPIKTDEATPVVETDTVEEAKPIPHEQYQAERLADHLGSDAISVEAAFADANQGNFKTFRELGVVIDLAMKGKRALIKYQGTERTVSAVDAAAFRNAVFELVDAYYKAPEPTESDWNDAEAEIKDQPTVNDALHQVSVEGVNKALNELDEAQVKKDKLAAQRKEQRRKKKERDEAAKNGDQPKESE